MPPLSFPFQAPRPFCLLFPLPESNPAAPCPHLPSACKAPSSEVMSSRPKPFRRPSRPLRQPLPVPTQRCSHAVVPITCSSGKYSPRSCHVLGTTMAPGKPPGTNRQKCLLCGDDTSAGNNTRNTRHIKATEYAGR